MNAPTHTGRRHGQSLLALAALATTVSVLGACASAAKTKVGSPAPGSTPSGPSKASVTVSAADVVGVGRVLVNGEGRTLYLLSSEKGGKITCTDDNGCTKMWPPSEMPSGMTGGIAGQGVQASLLGTAKGPSGDLYLTYGGWPLYTYSRDTGPARAAGQGISSFGGTWSVVSPAGAPITGAPSSPASTAGGGYRYP